MCKWVRRGAGVGGMEACAGCSQRSRAATLGMEQLGPARQRTKVQSCPYECSLDGGRKQLSVALIEGPSVPIEVQGSHCRNRERDDPGSHRCRKADQAGEDHCTEGSRGSHDEWWWRRLQSIETAR